jgi:Spy/CpxP family protein refolding chaperone
VLPDGVRDQLDLTAEQQRQVADLQKEVDSRLEKILTAEQKARLKAPRDRGRP